MRGEVARYLVLLIVLLGAGGGLYYQYQNTRPCVHPVAYAVGAVDSRFGLDKATLISDLAVAAKIWNKAAGKTVLEYDPAAALKVNLVYDEREANARTGAKISEQQDNLDSERAALDAKQADYVARQTAYNDKVRAINARGGATKGEAVSLEAEQAAISALGKSINDEVAAYNASVKALNASVAEFNKTAGHTFEEGEYVRDSSGTRINIFEFVGATQLERVLAHEFGHAIGLDHNDDPKSIMFAKNESGNLVPTAADLAALTALCGA